MHRKYRTKIPGTYSIYVASRWFSWSMEAGLLALSPRKFAPTINHGLLFASQDFFSLFFMSEGSGRRMPPAEHSAVYIVRLHPEEKPCVIFTCY